MFVLDRSTVKFGKDYARKPLVMVNRTTELHQQICTANGILCKQKV